MSDGTEYLRLPTGEVVEMRAGVPAVPSTRKLPHIDYRKRNSRIRRMGLAENYRDYLKSPRWRIVRARVLRRDRFKCQCCGEKAEQVHHTRYTKPTLRGKATYWLFAICRKCHKEIEFNEQGEKVTPNQANQRAFAIRRRNGLTTTTSQFIRMKENPKLRKKMKAARKKRIKARNEWRAKHRRPQDSGERHTANGGSQPGAVP